MNMRFLRYVGLMAFLLSSVSLFTETSKIDALVQETLDDWHIPGLALAVVHHGKTVKVGGYGVRIRGQEAPVDEHTLFQICSLTKAFTATTVSMLVDEGKLEWERPIIEYMPSFQLKDPFATKGMTLLDLLSHRTGLPGVSKQSWRLWYHTDRTSSELISRLRYLEPAFPFRSHFTYNNMSYIVASKVLEKVAGIPWQRFCYEKIFSPLGMQRTNISHETLVHDENIAYPHLKPMILKDPIPVQNWDNMAAAAGINSCAEDMARWLLFCLKKPSQMIQAPHTVMEREGFLEDLQDPAWSIFSHEQPVVNYGLGWSIYVLDGKKVLVHTGSGDGMQSIAALVPESDLGIVILSNQAPDLGPASLLNQLLDMFFDFLSDSWPKKARAAAAEIGRRIAERKKRLEMSKSDLPPTCALSKYESMYEHPAYGDVKVFLDGDHLKIELFTHEKGRLNHWDRDRFEIIGLPFLEPTIVQFEVTDGRSLSLDIGEMGVFARKDEGK